MMKQFKNLISFLTIICCLSGSILPAYAAQREPGVPTATFINEPNNSPDLYVTKQVECAAEGYTLPAEDSFLFILLDENDQPITDQQYHVLDPELGEITEYSGSYAEKTNELDTYSERWVKRARIPFTTGNSGIFTLRAGQTAWFEGFGVRKYKIQEYGTYQTPTKDETTKEWTVDTSRACCNTSGEFLKVLYKYEEVPFSQGGYSCISPANGALGLSEVLATGSSVTFTNRYVPAGAGGKAELRVSKSISFVSDYTAPDSPEFWFLLKIKEKPCVDEAYTILGAREGESQSGQTDRKGRFSLKGGQTAVFSQIEANADYEVSEILVAEPETEIDEQGKPVQKNKKIPQGWWPIGETSQRGTTGNSLVEVNFQNTNVAFGVMKTLSTGEKPENTEFTFRLTDARGVVMGGKRFLKYNTADGEPIYKPSEGGGQQNQAADDFHIGNQIIATGTTDPNDGTFTLRPGEAAIFINDGTNSMGPGTSYQVRELAHAGYTQIQPIPPADDSKDDVYTVSSSVQPQMIHFINQPIPPKGTLTVMKNVKTQLENPLVDDEFHFVLYQELKTYGDVKKIFESATATGVDGAIKEALEDENNTKYIALEATEEEIGNFTPVQQDQEPDGSEYLYTASDKKYRIYATAEKAVYSVQKGLETPTYATGPDKAYQTDQTKGLQPGEFTLEAEQTAIFKDLPQDRKYLVREIKLTEEYKEEETYDANGSLGYKTIALGLPADSSNTENLAAQVKGPKGQTAHLSADRGASFVFTNTYTPKRIDLYLKKTAGDGSTLLRGAQFALYLTQGKEGEPILPSTTLSTGTVTQPAPSETSDTEKVVYPETGADGMLYFQNLRAGTYWLYELKAPSGYCILKEPIKLEIKRTAKAENGGLEVLINGRSLGNDQKYNNMIGNAEIKAAGTEVEGQTISIDQLHITVKNTDLYELPNSGGVGIYWYTIGGTLLMLAAILILYRNNRQRRC